MHADLPDPQDPSKELSKEILKALAKKGITPDKYDIKVVSVKDVPQSETETKPLSVLKIASAMVQEILPGLPFIIKSEIDSKWSAILNPGENEGSQVAALGVTLKAAMIIGSTICGKIVSELIPPSSVIDEIAEANKVPSKELLSTVGYLMSITVMEEITNHSIGFIESYTAKYLADKKPSDQT